jgi:hypothetical protein
VQHRWRRNSGAARCEWVRSVIRKSNLSETGRRLWPGGSAAYICEGCARLRAYLVEQRRTADGAEPDPDQIAIKAAARKTRNAKIDHILAKLNCLESEVIKLRYGLSDGYSYNYDEIGEPFEITPEGVAEIETRSVEKLRSVR